MTEKDAPRKDTGQELSFFEWFESIEPYQHLYNHRMTFDVGYNKGLQAGLKAALDIISRKGNGENNEQETN
jgi:hypothetical protein